MGGRCRGGPPPRFAPTEAFSLVEAQVLDGTLHDAKDSTTFVGCEENPCGAAGRYGAKPWSDRFLEASVRYPGRIGNDWVNIPVLVRTEFENPEDSAIRRIARSAAAGFPSLQPRWTTRPP